MARKQTTDRLAYFTEYADQTPVEPEAECLDCDTEEFVFPEDYSTLTVQELNELHEKAVAQFDAIYVEGAEFSQNDIDALTELSKGIESLQAELSARAEQAAELAAQAAALASKVKGDEEPAEEPAAAEASTEAEAVVASIETPGVPETAATKQIRVNLRGVSNRLTPPPAVVNSSTYKTMKDVVTAAGELSIVPAGTGLDWDGVGEVLAHRLQGFNPSTYASAAASGRHLQQQFAVATIRKPIPDDLMVTSNDHAETERVLRHAMDEHRLKGGSLVASGGWCAPSETLYDLCEVETRDGLFSLPEIGVARGGIRRTMGPDFAEIFGNVGFSFTEENDIAGEYAVDGSGNAVVGNKPCYKVECPEFEEFRLAVAGLCISAGLLQSRAYPEMLARVTRGALVAHDHKMSARLLNAVAGGSVPVTMPAGSGALAPVLTAIELQVEHMKYTGRLGRGQTVEAVFPYWIRGVIRSDLAQRSGVDLISVPDSRIDAWFRERNIAPQFVYNWQDINTTSAADFTGWPSEVSFLLYPAGTWVRGSSDIITLDTLYDSVLLAQNDFTALFTEEAWMAVQMCHDSRVVTVPVCADGATSAGVEVDCNSITLGATTTTTTEAGATTTTTTV